MPPLSTLVLLLVVQQGPAVASTPLHPPWIEPSFHGAAPPVTQVAGWPAPSWPAPTWDVRRLEAPGSASAQEPAPPDGSSRRPGPTRRFFVNLGRDQRDFYLLPFRARPKDWLRWAPPLAAAAWATSEHGARPSLDEAFREQTQERRRMRSDRVSDVLGRLGDGEVAAVLLGATYLGARLAHAPRVAETTVMAGEAFLDSALLSYSLKFMTGRARPRNSDAGSDFGGPARSVELKSAGSFPSGHAMAAVAAATVIAERNPDRKWVAPLAYTVAGGVALSRVNDDHHYLSDVIVGGLAGHAVGRIVVRRHAARAALSALEEPSRFHFAPGWDAQTEAISLNVTILGKPPGQGLLPTPDAELRDGR